MSKIVELTGVGKRYGQKTALDSADVSLDAGKILGVLGPNGAGKTTLIKLLAGVARPDAGQIKVCGQPIGTATKALVSLLPDHTHLYAWLRVKEAIKLYRDCFTDFDVDRALRLCVQMEIDQNDTLSSLSKGMVERVLMMLTFSRNARLYLLDEPLGGIDPVARASILKVLRSSIGEDSAILLSTHQVKDVEALLDEVLFLCNGRTAYAGSAEHIREEKGTSIEEWYLEVMRHA